MTIVLTVILYPYVRAEYLTLKYGKEFVGLEYDIMDNTTYHKVIDYEDIGYGRKLAKVFYVSSGSFGCVVFFSKNSDQVWEMVDYMPIWSKYGNADEWYWPYYR